ncbi:MAG: DUF1376 domain-containing protein [Cyanobacteria bacterium P01_H01_bin.74]
MNTVLKLDISQYLAETAHLTTEEQGAYLLLIMNYWQTGKPLNNTNNQLANVVRMSFKQWKHVQKKLAALFVVNDDIWLHEQLEYELMFAKAVVQKRRMAGLAGAQKRWGSKTFMHVDDDASKEEVESKSESFHDPGPQLPVLPPSNIDNNLGSVEVLDDPECLNDSDKTLIRQACQKFMEMSPSILHHSNWVPGFLGLELPKIKQSKPELKSDDILTVWLEACRIAVGKGIYQANYIIKVFHNKIAHYTPSSYQLSGQTSARPNLGGLGGWSPHIVPAEEREHGIIRFG